MSGSMKILGGGVEARIIEINLIDYCPDERSRFVPAWISDEIPTLLKQDGDFTQYVADFKRKSYRKSSVNYDILLIAIQEQWSGVEGVEARIKAGVYGAMVLAYRRRTI